MNPEAGFALETAEQEPFEAPEPRHLADILQLSSAKIREMPIEELQRLHDEMVPHLGRPDKPSSGFAGYVEHLPAPLQKKIQKPGMANEYLRTYLETGLTTLRSRVRIEAQLAEPAVEPQISEADRRFPQIVNEYYKKNFSEWEAARQVVNRENKPASLVPEDQQYVDHIENRKAIQRAKGETFGDLTDDYELGFAQGLEHYHTFGELAEVAIHPTSKYDDYARWVDMIARIQPADKNQPEIFLGIDFTVTGTDIVLAKKLQTNRDQPVRRTKYQTRQLPKDLEYIPVVLSIDTQRAKRTLTNEAIFSVAKMTKSGESFVTQAQSEIEYYHDDAVFKYAVVEEVVAQLHVQRETLEDRPTKPALLTKYERAISYFEELLSARKNLQAQAELETKQREAVYRVADESFIRSAPDLVAGAAA